MFAKFGGPSSAIVPASGFASAADPKVCWSNEPPVGPPGAAGAAPPPKFGGATPTIVPLSRLGTPGPAPAAGAPMPIGGASAVKPGPDGGAAAPPPGAGAAGGCGTALGRGGAPGIEPGWFIISIVPLNLGAAAVLSWNPHFAHVCAVSVF
jgi:hypothetical protein